MWGFPRNLCPYSSCIIHGRPMMGFRVLGFRVYLSVPSAQVSMEPMP